MRHDEPGTTELMLQGYRLTTAQILYHMPDHPGLLQTFVWQHYDLAPDYPRLQQFLDYWRENIEAALHSVEVASARPLRHNHLHKVDHLSILH